MKDKNNKEFTSEEAREILLKEQKEKAARCQAEVQAALDKYKCVFDVSMILKAGQIIPQIVVVTRE